MPPYRNKAYRMRGCVALNTHRTRGAEHGESMNRTSPKLVLKGGLKGGGLDPIIVASRSHGSSELGLLRMRRVFTL